MSHPLLEVFHAAAVGEFPPADGRAVFLPPLPRGQQAVVSLTGRVYLATSHRVPGLDGFGSALAPGVLSRLAGSAGAIGTLDVTLSAAGRGGGTLPLRPELVGHPRVRHALALRENVGVYGDARGVVTVAAGLAGRTEVSVEVFPDAVGAGRGLIREALRLVGEGEPVFAAVAPGNARSLRAFLAEGFTPLGSEVIIRPAS